MKSKHVNPVLLFVFSIFLLPSCASLFSKSEYPVFINSTPEGARISILNGFGATIFEGTTPSLVALEASEGFFQRAEYMITISKPGYFEKQIHLQAQLDGWYLMNFFVGGVVGFLIIDPLTGNMWAIKEKAIMAQLLSREGGYYQSSNKPALQIMALADLDPELKDHLVEIPQL